MKDLTLSIILNLSTENIAKGLKKFKSQFQKSMKETEDIAKTSSRELDAAFATLGMRSLKEVQDEIKQVKVAYETLKKSGKLSAREQAEAQAQLKNRIKELENELNGWAKHLSSIRENWLGLIGLFAGAGYTIFQTTKTFVEFDDEMRQVAAVSGASKEQFKEMTALAREMGATTRYSASEAAGALKYLSMAGFGAEKSMKALPEVLNLASATATDLAQSADIVTNIMSQYGIQAEQLSHVNDVLVKATTSTNSSLIQLGNAFSYAGAIAKTVGLSFEETVAILGQLHNAGIKGERAGTALRGALARILNPSDEAKKVLKELGVTLYDNTGKMKTFLDILEDLQRAGATAADVAIIFGQEAGPGIQSLLNMGISSIRKLKSELEDSQGTAKKASRMLESGLGGALRELRSAIEELKIAFGDAFGPMLSDIIKTLTTLVRSLEDADIVTKFFLTSAVAVPGALAVWKLGLKQLVSSYVQLRASILEAQGANTLFLKGFAIGTIIYSAIQVGRLTYEVIRYKDAMNSLVETSRRYRNEAAIFQEYKNVEIKSAEELKKMSQDEVKAYRERLANAIRYWGHLEASLTAQKEERNIFLQKTEAAKKAEAQYEQVSQKANQYRQAVRELISATRQFNKETSQISSADFRALWQKTQQTIDDQTKSFNDQLSKLQQAHEFRQRLLATTQKEAQLEKALANEQRTYYSHLIESVEAYYTQQSQALDAILQKEKNLAGQTKNYQEEILKKKIEVANVARRALVSALDGVLQKEKQYAQQVKALNDQIVSAQQSLEDELRALRRSRLSEEEQIADKLQEAYEKQLKAREELEKGNYELAKRFAEQAKSLYADVARTSKLKFEEAYQGAEESGNLYLDVLKKQKEEAEKKWEEQKKLTEELKGAILELNKSMQEFTKKLNEIPEEKKMSIFFNESGLSEIKEEYNNIKDKDVWVTIHERVVETHQSGGVVGLSRGGKLPGFGGGDRIRALLEAGEFVIRKEAVRKYGVGFLSAINNMRFNLPSIPVPDVRQLTTHLKSPSLNTETYRKFEINIGGARLEGFAIKDIIDEFERHLRRRKLCGA